ncbi:AFG1/ZapE family ATPase [Pseudomonas aeruginosa]|nr:AFG1/ZapE family ATPase [Pseudomonas aeruginosa]
MPAALLRRIPCPRHWRRDADNTPVQELFRRKITLVCTSNYAPRQLLPNPLYHERFLPAIRLIETRMEVLEVSRRPGLPDDFAAAGDRFRLCQRRVLLASLMRLPGRAGLVRARALATRDPAKRREDVAGARGVRRLVWFAFADLCEAPTAVMDYLALGERFFTCAGRRTADGALLGRRPAALHQSRRRPLRQ